ncbi:MAG: hypothetical protein AAF657_22690 [Acidobacteriota bacterium]
MQGNFDGLRLVQNHLDNSACNDDRGGWLVAQLLRRQGHPVFPDLDDMVTRTVLLMENEFDPAIDDSATRYFILLKGTLRPSVTPQQWFDFILSVQVSRDKPGNPDDFDVPCAVTPRRCIDDNDACAGDPSNPDDNGYILHLYGTCFDTWLESGVEQAIRIDWGEVLALAVTLNENSDPSTPMLPPFEEITVNTVRIGMEMKPGEPRERSTELLIKDFTIYSKN